MATRHHQDITAGSLQILKGKALETLFYLTIALWFTSAIALIVLVLLHSGKGTGLSETFGGFQSSVGTGLIEKNLNRFTVIAAAVFVMSLLAFMYVWPAAS